MKVVVLNVFLFAFTVVFLLLAETGEVNAQCGIRIPGPGNVCETDGGVQIFPNIVCPGTSNTCCSTLTECQNETTSVRFRCDADVGCVQDPNGEFNSSGQCSVGCNVVTSFECDRGGTTPQCVEVSGPSGRYSTFARCANNCILDDDTGSGSTGTRSSGGESGILGGGDCSDDAISTAVGCIEIDSTNALFGFILKWAFGIAGGIALLLIGIAGFQVTTSQGDPKKLQGGRELLISAIAGLLMIIFAIFILRIIGVNILGVL